MKKDYIVLSAGELLGRNTMLKDYNGLFEKVNQKIKEGYRPIGGVAIGAGRMITFYQAMLKEE